MPSSQRSKSAFTLVELILVMVIISVMMTVATPYVTKSNRTQKLQEESKNLVEAINYIMDIAATSRKPTRLIIEGNSFMLEICKDKNGEDYESARGFLGHRRSFSKDVNIFDTTGFTSSGSGECLVFDPLKPWPVATITMMTAESIKTIKISCKQVEIYE